MSCDRDMNEDGVSWREYKYKKEAKLWALEVGWKEGRTSPGGMEPWVTLGLLLVGTNVKDVSMRVGILKCVRWKIFLGLKGLKRL